MEESKPNEIFYKIVIISTCLLLATLTIAVFAYRSVFDGGLSKLPTDWGALGSFFGGVFSPLISFVMLLALIQTIILQRSLFKNQSEQFGNLHALQNETLNSQKQQVEISENSLEYLRVDSHKQTLIFQITQQISHRQNIIDRSKESAEKQTILISGGKLGANGDQLEQLLSLKEASEKEVHELSDLLLLISLEEFSSIKDLNRMFLEKYVKIIGIKMSSGNTD